ncbi:MAG: chemotaxis protein CheW [Planctomycetaceae bacterium]|nr:chemotaxis protein CheW [Planctomycetaceae bacterium]
MTTMESPRTKSYSEFAGKYLTFRLGAEEYGIQILRVREIIGLMDVTPVPRAPAHLCGVINLRGRIIPIVDLRTKFGMAQFEPGPESCIIVLDVTFEGAIHHMGILVDGVCEVLNIPEGEIAPPPPLGRGIDSRYLLAIAKSKGSVKLLLDVEYALEVSEALVAADRDVVAR